MSPLPHEPASFTWEAKMLGPNKTIHDWWAGAWTHIVSMSRPGDLVLAHIRLANGQLVIVKPKAS